MIVSSQLALKTHTNFGCAASLATLDKLLDRFPLPPVALPIGDTSLTHIMRLAAHSTTSPTPTSTAMGHSFIMTLYNTLTFAVFVIFFCWCPPLRILSLVFPFVLLFRIPLSLSIYLFLCSFSISVVTFFSISYSSPY
jgi:hypothetical protein